MSIVSFWGLLGLLALPAIVILHLFRRHMTPRKVAGLFLFQGGPPQDQAGSTRMPLVYSASLWLELLVALLLVAWLAGLVFHRGFPPTHVVVVLDDSASMQAMVEQKSAVDRAKTELTRLLNALPRGSSATLVRTGDRPKRLTDHVPVPVALAQLDQWQPHQPWHSPSPALQLAQEAGEGTSDLYFFTDGPDTSAESAPFLVHSFGQPLANIGMTALRRSQEGNQEHVLVQVTAWSPTAGQAVQTELRLQYALPGQPWQPWQTKTLTLTPGKPSTLSVEVPNPAWRIQLTLPDDALAEDNHALLLPDEPALLRVANLLPTNTSEVLDLKKLHTLLPVQWVASPIDADVILRSAVFPLPPLGTDTPRWELAIGTPPGKLDDWKGPYIVEQRHPLLESLTFEGALWSAGRGPLPGIPLVSANEQTLLSEETNGIHTRWVLNLAPEQSRLEASMDWPILVAKVLERALQEGAARSPLNQPLGQLLQYPLPRKHSKQNVFWVLPNKERIPFGETFASTLLPTQQGLYQVEDGTQVLETFSVSFTDRRESNLQDRKAGVWQPRVPNKHFALTHQNDNPWQRRLFLLVALLVVCINWGGLAWQQRRRSV